MYGYIISPRSYNNDYDDREDNADEVIVIKRELLYYYFILSYFILFAAMIVLHWFGTPKYKVRYPNESSINRYLTYTDRIIDQTLALKIDHIFTVDYFLHSVGIFFSLSQNKHRVPTLPTPTTGRFSFYERVLIHF